MDGINLIQDHAIVLLAAGIAGTLCRRLGLSVVVGYLMFAEVPDFYTWLGTAVVVGAGLMVGLQGRKPQRI